MLTDKGYLTCRHRRYLKRLHKDNDPKIINNKQSDVTNNADLPNNESVTLPGSRQRRSSRLRGALSRLRTVKSVKLLEMGAEQSAPLTVEVKLEVDDGTITLKEVTTSEACKDHCECNGRRRNVKARKSKRAQALNGSYNREIRKPGSSSKFSTSYEANEGSHNRDGFKSNGNNSRQSSSSDGNNCDVSKYNGNSSRSSSSYDGSMGIGRA